MRFLLLLVLSSFCVHSQVDHWESVVLPGDSWYYILPNSNLNVNWIQLNYDDSGWNTGNSGFGYGDNDDETIIPATISVFIRKTFEIYDTDDIESVLLDIDYDDGFVAYINGQEIARNMLTGSMPDYDQTSDGWREPNLPQGLVPERFAVNPDLLSNGMNVIAVQVHNHSINSSDLTALPVLSLGINNSSFEYNLPPDWFEEPFIPNEVDFQSSNLPVVIINTVDNQEIPNDPKIDATMQIIYRENGDRNFLTDIDDPVAIHYDGDIKIEYRGASSSMIDKKQYAFTPYDEFGEKVNISFLDMPKENDWILNGLAFDPSFMRDFLSYNLSREIGNYASRGRYCELILNGDFRGIYVLQEKLKADDSRIDIKKIKDDDLTLPNLTGGYITKTDKISGQDVIAWSMDNYGGWQSNFVHEHPKPSDIAPVQHEYIEDQFQTLQYLVDYPSNNTINEGYPSLIDIPSFIDFIISNELASNVDAYEFSTFFHKDRNGKLRAGPLWDFNLTYGNDLFDWGYDRSHTDVWQFYDEDNMGPKFWKDLFDDPIFNCYLTKRWQDLTAPGMPLSSEQIFQRIDDIEVLISEAAERQEIVYGTTGEFAQQVLDIKTFINERIEWISNQLTDTSLCDNVNLPALVISKINYNPLVEEDLDSSDFEFIEITNNSFQEIDLTGIYFGGLGLTYQFTEGTILSSQGKIFLSNNNESFNSKYGFDSFDEFSRNLSNDSEELTLLDAYGNIIDTVKYNDDLPWPEEADGDGYFLQLVSLDLDNSLASSWVAVDDNSEALSLDSYNSNSNISLLPNPVSNLLTIKSNFTLINKLELFNIEGQLIQEYFLNNLRIDIDLVQIPTGVYFVKIVSGNDIITKKIIKK